MKDRSIDGKRAARLSLIDTFYWAGELHYGFLLEGFLPLIGVDIDSDVEYVYSHNNRAGFMCADIREPAGHIVAAFAQSKAHDNEGIVST